MVVVEYKTAFDNFCGITRIELHNILDLTCRRNRIIISYTRFYHSIEI